MKHPFLLALGLALAVLVGAFVPSLWHMLRSPPGASAAAPGVTPAPGAATAEGAAGLPWQVDVRGDGSARVMGLHLGVDTLSQARERAGTAWQLGIVARPGEIGTLEALSDPFSAGFVSGRLVMAFDVPEQTLRRWREASTDSARMEGGARRFALTPEHQAEAAGMPLTGLSYVPLARLSRDDVLQRFGPPETEQALDGGAVRLLYPSRGVAASVAEGRRGVIEYVAPRDAARLQDVAPVAR